MEVLMVVFDHISPHVLNSTNTGAGSISGIYDCAHETTVRCTTTRSFCSVSDHDFKSI